MAKVQKKIQKRLQDRLRAELGKGDHHPTPADRSAHKSNGKALAGSQTKRGGRS